MQQLLRSWDASAAADLVLLSLLSFGYLRASRCTYSRAIPACPYKRSSSWDGGCFLWTSSCLPAVNMDSSAVQSSPVDRANFRLSIGTRVDQVEPPDVDDVSRRRVSSVFFVAMEDGVPKVVHQKSRWERQTKQKQNLPVIPSSSSIVEPGTRFSAEFFDKSLAAVRATYLKIIVAGVVVLGVVVFGVCAIYWGSIWSTPHHSVSGWIVNFDGGLVGGHVVATLLRMNQGSKIVWEVVPASRFFDGLSEVKEAVVEEKTWVAVAINAGTSLNLTTALSEIDQSYNSSLAITFVGSEARNEAEYRNIIQPLISSQLEQASRAFALEFARNISQTVDLAAVLSNAPQLITEPISYVIDNVRPFDVPVYVPIFLEAGIMVDHASRASAVTFVGLIYMLILAFFMLVREISFITLRLTNRSLSKLLSNGARMYTGLDQRLSLGSLIRVRLITCFVGYFFVALFYTLLSLAFKLPFDTRYGKAGFVIFWMLNWIGMLACGLALESLATILTIRYIPLFLVFWIISNMSIAGYPLQVLPHIYRFGYFYPFYNISRGVRSIVFGTKDDLGINFGILLAWVVISCSTLPVFQWWMRRKVVRQSQSPSVDQKT
ncbi:DUF3533 domain-containing protein [Mycena sanguinolenta]|uniref:DUF3533 domain-containing protein n=1 Tax=Mycena sanguinolenta TaxID=230812 RepID=A0A8H6Y1U5_9AGAR|nr:DUF3533 domain-containing protein [Mycena sanguinolenta]